LINQIVSETEGFYGGLLAREADFCASFISLSDSVVMPGFIFPDYPCLHMPCL